MREGESGFVQERLLRSAGGGSQGDPAGPEGGLPQTRHQVPPRQESGRQAGRRALQGGRRGLQRAHRPAEAGPVRSLRPRRRERRRRPGWRIQRRSFRRLRRYPGRSLRLRRRLRRRTLRPRDTGPPGRRSEVRLQDLIRGRRLRSHDQDQDPPAGDLRFLQRLRRRPRDRSRHLPRLSGTGPAALPAGLLHHQPHLFPLPGLGTDHQEPVPPVPRRRAGFSGRRSWRSRFRPASTRVRSCASAAKERPVPTRDLRETSTWS